MTRIRRHRLFPAALRLLAVLGIAGGLMAGTYAGGVQAEGSRIVLRG
jgi:hypothetical protein